MSVKLADVVAAQRVIAGLADGTPFIPSPFLSRMIGHDVVLKLEIAQPVGAFKLRGAINAMAHLPPSTKAVTCCSTGNHGRALAYAAAQRGIKAIICMSELVPDVKVEAIRALGADVRIVGQSQDDAALESRNLSLTEGIVEIPPFDNAHVIAGQGTIALEMLAARPDLTTLLIPLSGGGLAAGVALAAKASKPKIKVIGISMENGAAMHESLRQGHPVEVTEHASLADSLGGGIGLENQLTFNFCKTFLDDVVLVSEEEIRDAMQVLYFEDRIVAEGASVVGLAALLSNKITINGPTATIITGRNLDMNSFTMMMAGEDILVGHHTLKGRRYAA